MADIGAWLIYLKHHCVQYKILGLAIVSVLVPAVPAGNAITHYFLATNPPAYSAHTSITSSTVLN